MRNLILGHFHEISRFISWKTNFYLTLEVILLTFYTLLLSFRQLSNSTSEEKWLFEVDELVGTFFDLFNRCEVGISQIVL